jgi:hypothetical protein
MKLNGTTRRRMLKALVPLENKEENSFVGKARSLGWQTRKMNGTGNKDWPDQLVLLPLGGVVLVEFKRVGVKTRPEQAGQRDKLAALRALGHIVETVTTAAEALTICELLLAGRRCEVDTKVVHGKSSAVPTKTRVGGALLKPRSMQNRDYPSRHKPAGAA